MKPEKVLKDVVSLEAEKGHQDHRPGFRGTDSHATDADTSGMQNSGSRIAISEQSGLIRRISFGSCFRNLGTDKAVQ